MELLTVNPSIEIKVELIGHEQTPVLIIDDFAEHITNIENDALQTKFNRDKQSYYPGARAHLPREYIIPTLQAIYLQICQIYKVPTHLNLQPQASYYSLLTLDAKELSLPQRVPHFDTSKPYFFAILHYLHKGEHGATGFFREKHTGYERISDARVEGYLQATNNYIQQEGEPPQEYFTRSNGQYELYHQIAYKPNRLVIYPGNLLHSTLVRPDKDLNADPKCGRLTANLFIDFQ